jgi:hypothetical protein
MENSFLGVPFRAQFSHQPLIFSPMNKLCGVNEAQRSLHPNERLDTYCDLPPGITNLGAESKVTVMNRRKIK